MYADCRAAQLQALQQPTNYYQQTPLQQTGFYQAQQTGSSLQVLTGYLFIIVVVIIVIYLVQENSVTKYSELGRTVRQQQFVLEQHAWTVMDHLCCCWHMHLAANICMWPLWSVTAAENVSIKPWQWKPHNDLLQPQKNNGLKPWQLCGRHCHGLWLSFTIMWLSLLCFVAVTFVAVIDHYVAINPIIDHSVAVIVMVFGLGVWQWWPQTKTATQWSITAIAWFLAVIAVAIIDNNAVIVCSGRNWKISLCIDRELISSCPPSHTPYLHTTYKPAQWLCQCSQFTRSWSILRRRSNQHHSWLFHLPPCRFALLCLIVSRSWRNTHLL